MLIANKIYTARESFPPAPNKSLIKKGEKIEILDTAGNGYTARKLFEDGYFHMSKKELEQISL